MAEKLNIEDLFQQNTFDNSKESNYLFWEAVKDELKFHYDNNEMYRKFCERKSFNPHIDTINHKTIPPVAVSVFKELGANLNSVDKQDIKFSLQSSATSGIPSTIVVDKITSKRQSKAMIRVVQEFIGKERKPFLIMDIDPSSGSRKLLGARFAAVSGYMTFASKVGYFLKEKENGISYFDINAMSEFLKNLPKEQPVIVFGFTYILYSNVLKGINESKNKVKLPKGSKIIHIGGWKKLESEKISKDLFNKGLADVFGVNPDDIIDIYGFTEQMGLNYPDCKCGCKHTSSFSRVVVRDIETREILEDGKEGMLEFITPIPHSYPGNAVLTDDIGVIIPGKCPYGRLGTRFKVIGRIKKAEIRGCGDILSSKLTFQESSKDEKDIIDNNLEICLYKGKISANESNEQMEEIVNYLKEKQKWLINQPVDAIIGLISQVAQTWPNNVSLLGLKDKGLLFLSSWCDNKHLKSISELGLRGNIGYIDRFMEFPNSDKHYLKANSRGLVCHWLAGNVQILGFFALIQSIITKNVNLLKISSRDNGVFVNILNTFVDTEYTTESGYLIKGNDLLETIAVVYFSRHAKDLGVKMSMEADVRIAWGGKEAIQTVSNYPAKFDCETVMFGPKLSFAVISKEELSSEQDAKKLARRVAIDTSVFDQTGCASPHNLYVEDGGNISVSRFLEILGEIMPKVELQIPKHITSIEQVSNIHSIRGIYDFKGYVVGSNNMSWTLLFDDKVERCSPIYSRVLFVHKIKSIYETLNLIDDNTQTIGIAAPKEKALDFALLATEKGVSRLPIIGRMLNFEMPWDGIILIDRLVKWNTYGGPLR